MQALSMSTAAVVHQSSSWSCPTDGASVAKWNDWNGTTMTHTNAMLDPAWVHAILNGRWLLLVGDSSVRMLFHLLVGVLSEGFVQWPSHWNQHGPRGSCLDVLHDNGRRLSNGRTDWSIRQPCVEDVFVRGVRLVFMWTELFEPGTAQLQPLAELANRSLSSPHMIVASIGAWFVFNYNVIGAEATATQFVEATTRLSRALTDVFTPRGKRAGYFPRLRTHRMRRLWLGLPDCGVSWRTRSAARYLPEAIRFINDVGRRQAQANSWMWQDRAAVSAKPCDAADCRYQAAHPVGNTLNVILKQVLKVLR